MTAFSTIFLIGLVAVIALQAAHRLAGSLLAVLWCGGVLVWGMQRLNGGMELHFFGIKSDSRVFAGMMVGFMLYIGWLVLKELKARKRTSS